MSGSDEFVLSERRRIRHDLRSVLGVAIGYADLAGTAESEIDREHFIRRTVETLERLNVRIGNLLADEPGGPAPNGS